MLFLVKVTQDSVYSQVSPPYVGDFIFLKTKSSILQAYLYIILRFFGKDRGNYLLVKVREKWRFELIRIKTHHIVGIINSDSYIVANYSHKNLL